MLRILSLLGVEDGIQPLDAAGGGGGCCGNIELATRQILPITLLVDQSLQNEVSKYKSGDVMRFSLFPDTFSREEGVV